MTLLLSEFPRLAEAVALAERFAANGVTTKDSSLIIAAAQMLVDQVRWHDSECQRLWSAGSWSEVPTREMLLHERSAARIRDALAKLEEVNK